MAVHVQTKSGVGRGYPLRYIIEWNYKGYYIFNIFLIFDLFLDMLFKR